METPTKTPPTKPMMSVDRETLIDARNAVRVLARFHRLRGNLPNAYRLQGTDDDLTAALEAANSTASEEQQAN